jgi:hypothetical protein
MNRIPIPGGWYAFATLEGDWGSLIPNQHILTSKGIIHLPPTPHGQANCLYLVGATRNSQIVMAGQNQVTGECDLYRQGQWFKVGTTFGVSPCAFSQDGQFLYVAESALTGYFVNTDTGERTDFQLPFEADGIRAVIIPGNQVILGNTTKYSPEFNLSEFINYQNNLVAGQSDTPLGFVNTRDDKRYLIEAGGCFFNRQMFDGFNIALATVKQEENQSVIWFLNVDELAQFPHDVEEPMPVIGKDCWLTWFQFNGHLPGTATPWNAQLKVAEGGPIADSRDAQFAQWVQGHSVEEIEQQALNNPLPCVVYWDGRTWPRLPIIKNTDWLALQAYCFKDETPDQFEANMRAVIESIPLSYKKIALVCQCYTSNDSLTKNLKGIVPVFARLARDNSRINQLLVFSDQGRPTGLNDHPELIPYWTELFDGITGEPQMSDGTMPQDVYDIIEQMHAKYAQFCIDTHPNDMEAAARMCTQMIIEQVMFSFPGQGYCWKSADANRPPSKDVQAQLGAGFFWGWDLFFASGANGPRDLNAYPLPVHDITGQNPIFPGDPKVPNFEARNWLELSPPSSINILVFEYTNPSRRSDPLGLLVKFEIEADHPVEEISFSINDGDLPFVWRHTEGKDGRYYRAIAFKTTVEGNWTLTITARDNKGNEAVKQLPITVIA